MGIYLGRGPATPGARSYGLGSLLALLVLIFCIGAAVFGHVTPLILLVFIAALALAMLIG